MTKAAQLQREIDASLQARDKRPCPNCGSIEHKKCCARCRKLVRWKDSIYCSINCRDNQRWDDKQSARQEIEAAAAREKKATERLKRDEARKKIPPSYRHYVVEATELVDRGESDATVLKMLKSHGLTDSEAQLFLDAAR